MKFFKPGEQDWQLVLEKPNLKLSDDQFFIIKDQKLLATYDGFNNGMGNKVFVGKFLSELADAKGENHGQEWQLRN